MKNIEVDYRVVGRGSNLAMLQEIWKHVCMEDQEKKMATLSFHNKFGGFQTRLST